MTDYKKATGNSGFFALGLAHHVTHLSKPAYK
jgi:hypothetical protein